MLATEAVTASWVCGSLVIADANSPQLEMHAACECMPYENIITPLGALGVEATISSIYYIKSKGNDMPAARPMLDKGSCSRRHSFARGPEC